MIRLLFATHRYLGMAIGLVMVIWCLSGFVMMYVPYPDISREQQLRGLPLLDLEGCCELSRFNELGLVDVHRFRIEMMGETPVIRFFASGGRNPTVDLSTGREIRAIAPEQAQIIAEKFQQRAGITGDLQQGIERHQDQWTVTSFYDLHRPLYFFEASNDPARSQWYVSSRNGQVVQYTTANQRFWNWLGAIPHWLYPTVLRQHDALWPQPTRTAGLPRPARRRRKNPNLLESHHRRAGRPG